MREVVIDAEALNDGDGDGAIDGLSTRMFYALTLTSFLEAIGMRGPLATVFQNVDKVFTFFMSQAHLFERLRLSYSPWMQPSG